MKIACLHKLVHVACICKIHFLIQVVNDLMKNSNITHQRCCCGKNALKTIAGSNRFVRVGALLIQWSKNIINKCGIRTRILAFLLHQNFINANTFWHRSRLTNVPLVLFHSPFFHWKFQRFRIYIRSLHW